MGGIFPQEIKKLNLDLKKHYYSEKLKKIKTGKAWIGWANSFRYDIIYADDLQPLLEVKKDDYGFWRNKKTNEVIDVNKQ